MDEETRLKARELLLKARVYKFFAIAFAGVGAVVFISLYFKHIDGHMLSALSRLSTVVMIIVPFLPALLFTFLSGRAEKKLMKTLGHTDKTDG